MNPSVKSSSSSSAATTVVPFNNEQREAVAYLYNFIGNNKNTQKIINVKSFDVFEDLNRKRPNRWMKQSLPKPTGRPISEEFEHEVLAECEQSSASNKKKVSSTANKYPYNFVRECAATVFDREYWDENDFCFVKKWRMDPHTSKLQLTNKWVVGLLRRDLKKSADALSKSAEVEVEVSVEQVQGVKISNKVSLGTSSILTSEVITMDPVVTNEDNSGAIVPILGFDGFDFDRLFEDFDSHHRISSASSSNLSTDFDEDFQKLLEMDIDWSMQ